jgi:hypothetical protein
MAAPQQQMAVQAQAQAQQAYLQNQMNALRHQLAHEKAERERAVQELNRKVAAERKPERLAEVAAASAGWVAWWKEKRAAGAQSGQPPPLPVEELSCAQLTACMQACKGAEVRSGSTKYMKSYLARCLANPEAILRAPPSRKKRKLDSAAEPLLERLWNLMKAANSSSEEQEEGVVADREDYTEVEAADGTTLLVHTLVLKVMSDYLRILLRSSAQLQLDMLRHKEDLWAFAKYAYNLPECNTFGEELAALLLPVFDFLRMDTPFLECDAIVAESVNEDNVGDMCALSQKYPQAQAIGAAVVNVVAAGMSEQAWAAAVEKCEHIKLIRSVAEKMTVASVQKYKQKAKRARAAAEEEEEDSDS